MSIQPIGNRAIGIQALCVRALALLSLAIAMLACSEQGAPSPGAADGEASAGPLKVVLQTDWYPQPEHAGFYVAQAKGYYRDAGLDVEIRPGGNAVSVPQLVATGRVQMGIGTTDNLMVAQSRGVPLVSLFPYFQHDPQCVMFHKGSGIKTLADLDGRTVMVNPGAAYVAYLQKSLGIRLQLVPMDFSLARFLKDPTFVQQCFLTSEPWYVAQQGVEPGVLPLSSSGFDPYRVVFANAEFVAAHPEQVRAFISASLRGWREYADGDPAEVHAILAKLNPQQTLEHMAWTRTEMAARALIVGNVAAGEGLGHVSRTRVRQLEQQLSALGLLARPVPVETAFALDLLPAELLRE